jgi:hypothetical protein
MPSPDTLAAIAILAAMGLAVLVICRTEPGGAIRLLGGEHPGRRVRPAGTPRPPHAKPLVRHAATRGFAVDATPLSALETAPDPVVSPFAARAI